jgi:hypothetical protein
MTPATAGCHPTTLAADVLGCRDGLQVVWVDASFVLAEVVEREPFGDRADKQFVGNAMGSELFVSDSKGPITTLVLVPSTGPFPTLSGLIDKRPEPFGHR